MVDELLLYTCPRCLQLRPEIEYVEPVSNRNRYICNTCFRDRDQLRARERWDWACALKKGTKMHVTKMHGREGIYFDSLDEDIIRALMRAQQGKCAVTNEPFYLPPDSDLKKNVTMLKWQQGLEPHNRRRIPVMARVNYAGNWVPGNVILIMDGIRDYYEFCGGIKGLHYQCDNILKHMPTLPTDDQLHQIRTQLIEDELKQLK